MSRLYLFEFLVTELNLADQIIRDAGDAVFAIKIRFVDFPSFEITRHNVSSARVKPPRIKSRLEFRAGYACHFTIPAEKLLKKVLRHPLSIKIFRKGDSFPICLAELPLSGCLCDQAKTAVNFPLPKPYVFGGKIGLVDIGGNQSGNVDIMLRITSRGKYVVASYVLKEDCFLFKNESQFSTEFKVEPERHLEDEDIEDDVNRGCGPVDDQAKDEVEEDTCEGIAWENYMSDVAVIFPSAGSLSLIKQTPKVPRVSLAKTYAQEAPIEAIDIVKNERNKTKIKKEKKKKNNKKK